VTLALVLMIAALLLTAGAIGSMVWVALLLRQLKRDGFVPIGTPPPVGTESPTAATPAPPAPDVAGDEVHHPAHYAGLVPEPLDVIEAWGLTEDHHRACAIKYIARCGRKGSAATDLRKAAHYLERRARMFDREGT